MCISVIRDIVPGERDEGNVLICCWRLRADIEIDL